MNGCGSGDDSIVSLWQEQIAIASGNAKLRRQLEGEKDELFFPFAEHYRKLRGLPRRARRTIQRKWKRRLAGVASTTPPLCYSGRH